MPEICFSRIFSFKLVKLLHFTDAVKNAQTRIIFEIVLHIIFVGFGSKAWKRFVANSQRDDGQLKSGFPYLLVLDKKASFFGIWGVIMKR